MIPATRQSTRREELSPSWTPHYVSAKLVFVSFWVACLTPIIENARRADDKCSVLISEIFAKDFFQKQIYVAVKIYQRICLHEIQIPTGKHAITHTHTQTKMCQRGLFWSRRNNAAMDQRRHAYILGWRPNWRVIRHKARSTITDQQQQSVKFTFFNSVVYFCLYQKTHFSSLWSNVIGLDCLDICGFALCLV